MIANPPGRLTEDRTYPAQQNFFRSRLSSVRRPDGYAIRRKKRFDLLSRGICNPPIPSICRLLPGGWG